MKVNRRVSKLKSSYLLNEKITNNLLRLEAKTPQFKLLPKVHKEGNPGRFYNKDLKIHWQPVTATCKITQVVYQRFCRFHAENHQHGKKTWQQHPCNHGCMFSTYKYCKQEGVAATKTTLKRKKYTNDNYLYISPLGFNINEFVFNCQNYLQIKGCTMSTKCPPSYTNIFMGISEER